MTAVDLIGHTSPEYCPAQDVLADQIKLQDEADNIFRLIVERACKMAGRV